jgi:two-component system, sensor histidine kinase
MAFIPKSLRESADLLFAEFDALPREMRVLLVDDNAINRKVAQLFMSPFRINVTEVDNGTDALDWLAAAKFDAVLLDQHMPGMDGAEVLRSIRSSGKS